MIKPPLEEYFNPKEIKPAQEIADIIKEWGPNAFLDVSTNPLLTILVAEALPEVGLFFFSDFGNKDAIIKDAEDFGLIDRLILHAGGDIMFQKVVRLSYPDAAHLQCSKTLSIDLCHLWVGRPRVLAVSGLDLASDKHRVMAFHRMNKGFYEIVPTKCKTTIVLREKPAVAAPMPKSKKQRLAEEADKAKKGKKKKS